MPALNEETGLKLCTGPCEKEKPAEEFSKDKYTKDKLKQKCKDCCKKYWFDNIERMNGYTAAYRRERQIILLNYKREFPCVICGETHPAFLHLHHINNNKLCVVSEIHSIPQMKKEIEKCIVLCSNCHILETKKQRKMRGRVVPGTNIVQEPKVNSLRVCIDCGNEKDLSEFSKHKRGVKGRAIYCKLCMLQRAFIYRAERYEYINIFLKTLCVNCGESNFDILQCDHRDDEVKLFSIGHGCDYSFKKLREELMKCDVRCANCHAYRTYKQQNWYGNITDADLIIWLTEEDKKFEVKHLPYQEERWWLNQL